MSGKGYSGSQTLRGDGRGLGFGFGALSFWLGFLFGFELVIELGFLLDYMVCNSLGLGNRSRDISKSNSCTTRSCVSTTPIGPNFKKTKFWAQLVHKGVTCLTTHMDDFGALTSAQN